jgi:hypothetical protein
MAFTITIFGLIGQSVVNVTEWSKGTNSLDSSGYFTDVATVAAVQAGATHQNVEVVVAALAHGTPQLSTETGGYTTIDQDAAGYKKLEVTYTVLSSTSTGPIDSWSVTNEEYDAVICCYRANAGVALVQSVTQDTAGGTLVLTIPMPTIGNMLVVNLVSAASTAAGGAINMISNYGGQWNQQGNAIIGSASIALQQWAIFNVPAEPAGFQMSSAQ